MDHPFSGASEFFPGRDVPPPFDFAQDGGIPGTQTENGIRRDAVFCLQSVERILFQAECFK
jgi:hypothetical protein